ncbi:MAG: hypothetical protein ACJAYU_002630 [Bradymonadia bacterium]|jgi:hypothetical protein
MACGGYSQRLAEVRDGAAANNLEVALAAADQLVIAGQEGRSPQERDLPLLLLERGTLYQAMGLHELAVTDFTEADQMLEVLDLSSGRAGNAAEYLWSGSKKLYRPPIYEKLLVNVMAASSFMAAGSYRSAMVEARRIRVLWEYFSDTDLAGHPMLSVASYIAALAMELGGEEDTALRFYADAWSDKPLPGLAEAIARMSSQSGASIDSTTLDAALAEASASETESELITITFSGMAPYRVAQRIPIGAVFIMMRQNRQYALGESNAAVYNRIVAEGLLTWINFPTLVAANNGLGTIQNEVDGRRTDASLIANVELFAMAQWEAERSGIAFAAITRAIVRVLAREGIQAATRAGNNQAVETLGFIASLATQAAMQAADQPDTRTWNLMPARVWVSRTEVEPGSHAVSVRAGGVSHATTVEVRENGVGVAVFRIF